MPGLPGFGGGGGGYDDWGDDDEGYDDSDNEGMQVRPTRFVAFLEPT